ncbi:MAG: ribulose-phosphate 3-epimerase [Firmicutes bacterium]|nr:ribulose-phosphate 3-epimerase [Bacillota bacterium]
MKRLAPSILSADFSALAADVNKIETAGAHLIHVDVMDGHFVPNITIGSLVMKSLIGRTSMPFDVHLMISDPDKYINEFVTQQTEFITVHAEACIHLHRTLQQIRSLGVKAGVALNPATSLSRIEYIFEDADLILIMSVNPGFGGQKFINSAVRKVEELARIRTAGGYNFEIEIDGGIGTSNIKTVTEAGVDIAVAGSAVFGAESVENRVRELISLME